MAQRRGNRVRAFSLTIGNDPSLWRYGSLGEALAANIDIIARMIRAGEEAVQQEELALDDAIETTETEAAAR